MQDWLVGIVGADLAPIVSVILAAVFVVVLALVVITLLRRVLGGGIGLRSSSGPRVEIVDVTAVDQKRKLVLVRRDQIEHLILIGGQNDLVVEAHIGRVPPQQRRVEPPAIAPPSSREPAPASAMRPTSPTGSAPSRRGPEIALRGAPLAEREEAGPVRAAVRPAAEAGGPVRSVKARAEPSFAPPPASAPGVELDDGRLHRADAPSPRPTTPSREETRPAPTRPPETKVERPAETRMEANLSAAPAPIRAEASSAPPRPVAPALSQPMRRTNPVAPAVKPDGPPARAVSDPIPQSLAAPSSERRSSAAAAASAPPVAPAVVVAPERRVEPRFAEGAGPEGPQMAPPVATERQPLSVRSFATSIQARQSTAAPAAPGPAARVESPEPPHAGPAAAAAEPDDLALERTLSDEFDRDWRPDPQQLSAPGQGERHDPAPKASNDPAEGLGAPAPPASTPTRELSLEEEMERLLRDFSLHTGDRR